MLIKRKQLGDTVACGWPLGQFGASQNMTGLAKYTADLYTNLEEETGMATSPSPGVQGGNVQAGDAARAFEVESR